MINKKTSRHCEARHLARPWQSLLKSRFLRKLRLLRMTDDEGFTLVEVLVVIAMSAIILTILTQVFFSSLKGNNKAQLIATIKQNGQSVIDTFDKNIRDADNIVCPSTGTSKTLIIVKQGVYTRYRFVELSANCVNNQNCNGDILRDNPTQSPTETAVNFVDSYCSLTNIEAPFVASGHLVDNSSSQGVAVASGSFKVYKSAGFKTVVNINFQLQPSDQAAKKILGTIDPVTFNTSIGLR